MEKKISNIDTLTIIEENIKDGNPVTITVRGNSMSPLLLDGIDKITLYPFVLEELRIGDIILFKFKDAFLLHRIIEIENADKGSKIVTKGDALDKCEEIDFSDVVAVTRVSEMGPVKKIIRIIYCKARVVYHYFTSKNKK